MADIRLTELDFESIKANLKNFLKAQSELTDYDFEGSTMAVLLDTLAYNTHYNAMLAHLLANEMFIDTAIKRSSVVSHAKSLGYIPRSGRAAVATVKVTVIPVSDDPAPVISLPKTLAFATILDDLAFTFFPKQAYTAVYDQPNNQYVFPAVELIEGVRMASKFTVTQDTVSGPFLIPTPNIDTTTVSVFVKPSSDSFVTTVYSKTDTIIDLLPTSKVFWVEETPTGRYQLLFGNDVVGAQLKVGNVVYAEYFQTSASEGANGASIFALASNFPGASDVVVDTVSPAAGGAPAEDIDSIRFNAPRLNATRNRAVTAQDYKTLIKSMFPFVKGIAVWGGEDNVPPIYGKVFISIDTVDNYVLTESDKTNILKNILQSRSMLTLSHEFVEPEYLYIGLMVDVKYNALSTTLDAGQMRALVTNRVNDYFDNEVSTLDKTMYYSKLLAALDSADQSIIAVQASLRLNKLLQPVKYENETVLTVFNTQLEPGSVRSSNFFTTLDDAIINNPVFIQDAPNAPLGIEPTTGTLKLINASTGTVVADNYGTVDYMRGVATLNDLYVRDYPVGVTGITLYAVPQDGHYDISPAILNNTELVETATMPAPSRNLILRLDKNGLNNVAGVSAGVTVSATPIIASS
jgi:hypothetical protein